MSQRPGAGCDQAQQSAARRPCSFPRPTGRHGSLPPAHSRAHRSGRPGRRASLWKGHRPSGLRELLGDVAACRWPVLPPLTRSEGITVAAGACRACCTNVGELGACPLCPGDHHQASCWPTRAPPATLSGWRVQHPLWGAQGSPMSGVAEAMVGTGLVSHLIVPRGTFCCSGQMAR